MASNDLIYNQIEGAADYYSPKVYAILNGFGDFTPEQDDGGQFIPLTAARPNPVPFIVGLLPPSSNVTGRLLDRSASVAAINGLGQPVASSAGITNPAVTGGGKIVGQAGPKGDKGFIVTADGFTVKAGTGTSGGAGGAVMATPTFPTPSKSSVSREQLWGLLYNAYVQLKGVPPTPTELQQYCVSILQETGGQAVNGNFGGVGNYDPSRIQTGDDGIPFITTSDGTKIPVYIANNGHGFKSYSSLEEGAKDFLSKVVNNDNAVASAQAGDVMGYLTSLAQRNYYTESVQVYYETGANGTMSGWARQMASVAGAMKGLGVDLDDGSGLPQKVPGACAFHEDSFQYVKRVGNNNLNDTNVSRFKRGSPYNDACPLSTEGEPQGGVDWQKNGSDNAKHAAAESDSLAGTDFNRTQLGQKFLKAQTATIQATINELEKMRKTPPLKMLVNPQSFKVSSDKIISDGNWTRNGPILEHWGNGQDKLEASGRVAGFYASDMANPAGPGLGRTARTYSAAYQNLLSLWLLYRNNGALYLNLAQITGIQSEITRLSVVGSIYIYYDGILYFGSFDNFSLTESDGQPFSLEYSFQFTVRSAFLLDKQPDPRFTYGNPKLLVGDPSIKTNQQTLEDQVLALGGGPVAPPPGTAVSGDDPFAGVKQDLAKKK